MTIQDWVFLIVIGFFVFSSWAGLTGRTQRWNQALTAWAERLNPDKEKK